MCLCKSACQAIIRSALRVLTDSILGEFDGMLARRYAEGGRPSIQPLRLLRASLLQVIYSVRSERLLMEQLDYNLLFLWFVVLHVDDPGSLDVLVRSRTGV
jgi:transposase